MGRFFAAPAKRYGLLRLPRQLCSAVASARQAEALSTGCWVEAICGSSSSHEAYWFPLRLKLSSASKSVVTFLVRCVFPAPWLLFLCAFLAGQL